MELRVLGPLEVRHDGSPVSLRGSKPRQLLVLLAMRANRPVSSEQLIEELWEGEPPPSAATALRVHIAKLRRALEPDRGASIPSGRLPAGPNGYLLRVEPDELDAQRFERLVVLGRDANAAGDLRSAVALLTQALDLWHGPALLDAQDLSAARAEIARLEELRVDATEELAEARLGCGEHAFVVDVLVAIVEKYPLRERLTGTADAGALSLRARVGGPACVRAARRSTRRAAGSAAVRRPAPARRAGAAPGPGARFRRAASAGTSRLARRCAIRRSSPRARTTARDQCRPRRRVPIGVGVRRRGHGEVDADRGVLPPCRRRRRHRPHRALRGRSR